MYDTIIENIGQLILPAEGPLKGEAMKELNVQENMAIAIKDEIIAWIGPHQQSKNKKAAERIDALEKTVSPGLVDPHTHLVFGGSRENELALKQAGVPYLEILKQGGGILSTVQATRSETEEQLFGKAKRTLEQMAGHGVTTMEAKSGYGLDRDTELKQLRIVKRLNDEGILDLVSTFLGPHAIPPEYKGREEAFLEEMIQLLPEISEKSLAEFTDIFCETGVFTIEQSRRFMKASQELGFKTKIHADEIDPLGGTELAVKMGAASADHLVAASEGGIESLSRGETVAVLLPGTTFYLGKDRYADARRMIDAGAAVALATDFNPGSCVTYNLQMIMSLAALKMKMTPEEIWNGVTVNAAHAIGRGDTAGCLQVGRKADVVLWDVPNYKYIPYHYAANHAEIVWKNGRNVWERRGARVFSVPQTE
ncbi:imidazolonepropionase [Halobacillus karajensis]|uniref:Imidazolonepropionase n=1 Tax=Halobacillus karajensis TaxID=195088 RepID=A0A059NVE2_9BACI|nr:imidazolonepropionase [Halobacillus karajensis]CDQ18875.1 Imidazolonepropionase [Halobacillus karajensis]CDQ23052.1 Imidazolonepropionase [Halobacillus karajensis]CDQ26534.1 Imidazolonepropionase [Halobacillus karajensis]SEH44918.1 imidazolonepropionase [Halobacillus karajensis]